MKQEGFMSVKHPSNRKIMAIAKVAIWLAPVEQRHVARFRQMVVSGSL